VPPPQPAAANTRAKAEKPLQRPLNWEAAKEFPGILILRIPGGRTEPTPGLLFSAGGTGIYNIKMVPRIPVFL
jgi:hypothetical protein